MRGHQKKRKASDSDSDSSSSSSSSNSSNSSDSSEDSNSSSDDSSSDRGKKKNGSSQKGSKHKKKKSRKKHKDQKKHKKQKKYKKLKSKNQPLLVRAAVGYETTTENKKKKWSVAPADATLGVAETRLTATSESKMSLEEFTAELLKRCEIPQGYTLDLFVPYESGEDHIKIITAEMFAEWLDWHRSQSTSEVLCMQRTHVPKGTQIERIITYNARTPLMHSRYSSLSSGKHTVRAATCWRGVPPPCGQDSSGSGR